MELWRRETIEIPCCGRDRTATTGGIEVDILEGKPQEKGLMFVISHIIVQIMIDGSCEVSDLMAATTHHDAFLLTEPGNL